MTTGSQVTGDVGPRGAFGRSRVWSGVDDPEKKRVNPYTNRTILQRSDYFCTAFPYPFGNTCGNLYGLGSGTIDWDDNDENKLLDKLFTKMRGHEFNAGVFIGQSHELASQIVGTTRALSLSYMSLKRGDLGGALRNLSRSVSGTDVRTAKRRLSRNDLHGTWLSLQYGWIPAYHDIAAACEAFEVMSAPRRGWEITVTRNKKAVIDVSQSPSLYQGLASCSHSQRLRYRMEEDLPYERRMGLTDVSSVVWELVPWSFVVDWFVPIGTYLSNLSMAPLIKGTVYRTIKTSSNCTGVVPVSPYYQNGGVALRLESSFNRDGGSTSLRVPLPNFKGLKALWSSTTRTLNALALMSTVFSTDPSVIRKARRG